MQGKFNKASPFLGFKFLPESRTEKTLSIEEEEKLHQFLNREKNPPYSPSQWLIVDFALNTACRAGEIINLRWEYINLDRRVITIPLTYTKEKAIKQIHINDYLYGLLSQLKNENGNKSKYVFLTPEGEPYKSVHSLKFFTRACKKLGIKDVSLHVLRHTAITRLLSENNPLDTVARIAGHRNISTTMRYAHVNPVDKLAVNTLNKYRESKVYRTKYRTTTKPGKVLKLANKP